MFPLIDYRIKILIFSNISKFSRFYSGLCPGFFHLRTVCRPPCRALSCIIARHSPTSVRKVQTTLRKVLPLSYRQREGRFRTRSPDYPENLEKPTGGYLSIDWSMQLNRPHDPFATTGQYLSIDWSISWHRLVNAAESTAHFPGIDWSILASTGQYLSIDWSISWHRLIDARMAGTRKSGVCKELIY